MDEIKAHLDGLKTEPYSHQRDAFLKAGLGRAFANFSDQGTGKTWSSIAELFALYRLGKIDRCLILAPKGVDSNWIVRELPKHAPDDVPFLACLWRPTTTKTKQKELADFLKHPGLKVLAANWETLNHKRGLSYLEKFIEGGPTMAIADESQRIKTPTSQRTKRALELRHTFAYRRILSGTPAPNGPFDLWSQLQFLDPKILACDSFRAFCTKHAVMEDDSDHVYAAIKRQMKAKIIRQNPTATSEWVEKLLSYRMPKLIRKDHEGRPMYRKLDELKARVQEFSFRVLKEDCLDLPPKVYTQMFFDISPEQRRVYKELETKNRLLFEDDTIQPVTKLTAMQKMSQVCSGYFLTPEGTNRINGDNPKLEMLTEFLEDLGDKKLIVWAYGKQEIRDIEGACHRAEVKSVSYHGSISDKDRDANIDSFQESDAQVFIGHPQSGGVGLTLTAASTVVYYSNSFNLEHRLQSEDRAHRIGQVSKVSYIDFVASGTIEVEVIQALQDKADLAAFVMGDKPLKTLGYF